MGKSESKVVHEVTVFDPLEVFGEGGALAQSGCELTAPHFFFKAGSAPAAMDAMRDAIKAADAILVVTAEYNHAPPPALLSMLDHFGGSNYNGKPSGIITYSPGPWGGAPAVASPAGAVVADVRGWRLALALALAPASVGLAMTSRTCHDVPRLHRALASAQARAVR